MQQDGNYIEYTTYGINFDFVKKLYELFGGSGDVFNSLQLLIQNIWFAYSVLAFLLSALFIYGIIYSFIRMNELSEAEAERIANDEKLWQQKHGGAQTNQYWSEVQTHIASDNPNDWKLAIIEADVMLDRMLTEKGFAGTTIADKLRSASGRSFSTLDDAWQAHRVRNHIAHGGSDFVLTQKMARETIIQYQRVFQEFSFI